jgi:hypothetical protein
LPELFFGVGDYVADTETVGQVTLETALTSCTECGAEVGGHQDLCPRCHRPRWYTLKKISACVLIIVILMALIKYAAVYGDRTLGQWFG